MKKEQLQFYGKKRCSQEARKTGAMDVTISRSTNSGKSTIRFTFRNGVSNIISETDYLQYALPKGKRHKSVYFMTGTHDTGLKMTASQNAVCDNRYLSVYREDEVKRLEDLLGDYELQYDQECELYYITR